MPDRCVVAGFSNTPDAEKGIALHKIPFYGDQPGVKRLTVSNQYQQQALFLISPRVKLTNAHRLIVIDRYIIDDRK